MCNVMSALHSLSASLCSQCTQVTISNHGDREGFSWMTSPNKRSLKLINRGTCLYSNLLGTIWSTDLHTCAVISVLHLSTHKPVLQSTRPSLNRSSSFIEFSFTNQKTSCAHKYLKYYNILHHVHVQFWDTFSRCQLHPQTKLRFVLQINTFINILIFFLKIFSVA